MTKRDEYALEIIKKIIEKYQFGSPEDAKQITGMAYSIVDEMGKRSQDMMNTQQITIKGAQYIDSGKKEITTRELEIQILNHLNMKSGKKFEPVESNLKFIRARLKDDYLPAKLMKMVDVKCDKWLHDEKMREFLRPSTLFNAEKCAQYMGEIDSVNPSSQYQQSKELPDDY